MRGVTHALYGLVIGVFAQYVLSVRVELAVLVAVFGALLPDIDEPSSLFGRHVKLVGWFSKHRGFWHSLFVMIIGVVAIESIARGYGLVFGAAFASHLVLDGMTHAGVHLFWPSKLHIKGFCKTGGVVEWIVRGIGVLLLVIAFL